MGKFTHSGPDWTDITILMSALGELHAVDVNLQMSLGGARETGCLHIVAMAIRRQGFDGGLPNSVSRRHTFPNTKSPTMEGTVFRLLYELDRDCGTMWHQETMPVA